MLVALEVELLAPAPPDGVVPPPPDGVVPADGVVPPEPDDPPDDGVVPPDPALEEVVEVVEVVEPLAAVAVPEATELGTVNAGAPAVFDVAELPPPQAARPLTSAIAAAIAPAVLST